MLEAHMLFKAHFNRHTLSPIPSSKELWGLRNKNPQSLSECAVYATGPPLLRREAETAKEWGHRKVEERQDTLGNDINR